jgi:hypothetical protein
MARNKVEKKKERATGRKWPDLYIKEMETVRGEIREKEEKGVNVNRAWRLFGIARGLNRKEDAEKAFDYMEKVRGDLAWKERLYGYSTRTVTLWVAYGVPILIAVPLIGYIIAKCGFDYDLFTDQPVRLGMPVFILAWGYIGSVAYVLISVSNKISKRLLDIRDPLGYFYRIILGGILAGVVFYIIQMGLISLPGTAGEEVNAALLSAGVAEKNRKVVMEYEDLEKKLRNNNEMIQDFKRGYLARLVREGTNRESTIGTKAKVLEFYESEWIGYGLENNNNANLKGPIKVYKIKSALKTPKKGGYRYISDCFDIVKIKMIITKKEENANLEGLMEEKEVLRKRMEYKLESVRIDKDIKKLDEKIKRLENAKEEKEDAVYALYKEEEGAPVEEQKLESPGTKARGVLIDKQKTAGDKYVSPEWLNNEIGRIEKEIEEKEIEKGELKTKKNEAEKRENENPVWESAVFIVIAFFSGYSINFVTKIFDRAMTAIISGKPGATEMEGEVAREPEAGGEETVS